MNLVEGADDKTESGLRAILFAQAKVRLCFALTVIVSDLVLFFITPGGVPAWFLGLTAGYCVYVALPFLLIRNSTHPSLQTLLVATAVLDPLMLSIWIALTGEYGSLLAGFYLFTTLGFGFRTGRPLMHLCQIASIAGFAFALVVNPYWQQHPAVWTALLIPIIVVPVYAGTLIKTLRKAREHAEEQSRVKSDLLAKVSHELRTPLAGIVASAELLAVETSDASVARRTKTILTLSDNLLCEINDLLDEAKFDAKTVELSYDPVDLHQQIAVLRATFETMAARKGLAFRADVDPAITDPVQIDTHHLDRILLNLMSNAIKFTENGSVRLSVELIEQSATGYRLRFAVADSGIGIPESFRARMFEPFSQVDQGVNRRYGGTGLGLALSKRIIDAMGGELRFESTLGVGSRFWFELELRRAAATALVAEEISAPIVCGKRILVADDNESNLMLLKELLEVDAHEVTTCTSGMAALEALVKHDFDLLLLDYNLGDMDGVRVLQTYRFGRLNPIPALFLTADATMRTATRLQEAGGAGILYKPINLGGMRQALARLDLPDAVVEAPKADGFPGGDDAKSARPALKVVPPNPLNEKVIDELRKINRRPDFLPQLLAQAEEDIVRCCQQLLDALARKDYASIRTAAHALKGVSANVGAMRLVTLANTLMNMSSDDIASATDRLAADIRESSRAAGAALAKMTADASETSAHNAGSLHLD
jgi:two-component system sensor histidine kinase RpfC